MKKLSNTGFTLIEILVVVVIVSILTVMGVQMISSGSVERNLQQHGRILQASLEYACDQATFQNVPYGLKFTKTSYSFVKFINQQWLELPSEQNISFTEISDGTEMSLEIDDASVVLKDDDIEVPQVLCDATGQITDFTVLFSDATNKHHYQLKTIDFWTMQGQWLDEK